MTTTDKPVASKGGATVPDVWRNFQEMAAAIPTGGTDTALLNILSQLAAAATPEELAAPWETIGTEAILGRMLVVSDLKRMPSDFDGGLGLYLVVTAADTQTGEQVTFTTGATSVVAQLVKAHAAGWLPLKCELVESERATKAGYKPQHLRIYGTGDDF